MEELNQLVVDYLRQEHTDFAIMINGEWGCGKTYYIAHRLSDIIKSIDSGGGKKYTPAIISLYGVSSSEDFYCKVFLGLNQWAKAKWFGVANTAISIVAGVYGADTKKEDWAKLVPIRSNTVLVFDDMERICTDKISYKEILGLINSYAEQENRKVIIVCNEAEICKNDRSFKKEEYQLYKEKTIRFTYDFCVCAEEVFDSLLSQVSDENYHFFLASNKGIILQLFRLGGKCNYRTLKFIFDILAEIYSISIDPESYREKLIRNLIVSSMIYAMEYKNSISVEQLKSLKQREELSFDPMLDWLNKNTSTEDDKEKNKSISQIMKEKYGGFFIDDMQQLAMLVDYIATGYINREKLIERLNELAAEYQRQEETPEMKVYNKLKSFHTMADDSVIACIKEMIGYVANGSYSLCDIMHVYALLLKYDYWHIEDFTLTSDMDDIFVNSLRNKAASHQYDSTFEMSIPIWDTDKTSSVFERYNNLRELVMSINQQSYKESLQERAVQLLQSAEKEKVDELAHFREIKDVVNMSAEIDWKRVCSIIENAPNNVACEFIMCIEYLLRHDYNAKTVDLFVLQNWINQYIGENKTHIRKMYVVELKSVVESIYK